MPFDIKQEFFLDDNYDNLYNFKEESDSSMINEQSNNSSSVGNFSKIISFSEWQRDNWVELFNSNFEPM